MLESYFVKPGTVDQVRASWIGAEVERYVEWLAERGYSSSSVSRRVPLLVAFGEFAKARGAGAVEDLPGYVELFVAERVASHGGVRRAGNVETGRQVGREVRGPVEQMLRLAVPWFRGTGRRHRGDPFVEALPGFFGYLTSERGLRPATIRQYGYHLTRFERYLDRIGVRQLNELSPPLVRRLPPALAPAQGRITHGRTIARLTISSSEPALAAGEALPALDAPGPERGQRTAPRLDIGELLPRRGPAVHGGSDRAVRWRPQCSGERRSVIDHPPDNHDFVTVTATASTGVDGLIGAQPSIARGPFSLTRRESSDNLLDGAR